MFLSPFWFAGHLLMVVNKSVLLHIVIRSVLLNGWSLLLTALLTLIVVYLFIVIGYVFFQEDFMGTRMRPPALLPRCCRVAWCHAYITSQELGWGLSSGENGEHLTRRTDGAMIGATGGNAARMGRAQWKVCNGGQ